MGMAGNGLTIPTDTDAELAVLGCCLLDGKLADLADTFVEADDFSRPAHSAVFRAIQSLRVEGHEPDAVAVADRLGDELDRSGGRPFLMSLLANTSATSRNVKRYAEIVARTARSRRLIAAGTRIASLGYESVDDPMADAESLLATVERHHADAVKLSDVRAHRLAEITRPTDYLTPAELPQLHMRPKTVTVIAARQAVGKTAYAMQCAVPWSMRCKVGYWSYEMDAGDLFDRIGVARIGSSLRALDDGISTQRVELMREMTADLDSCDLTIDDTCPTFAGLLASLRRFARMGGRVAVIDYFALAVDDWRDRFAAESQASRALKVLAKDTGLSLMVLHQVRKQGAGSDLGAAPTIEDIKGSSAIIQDADIVVIAHRYRNDDTDARADLRKLGFLTDEHLGDPDWNLCRFEIAKQRRGPVGVFPMWFAGHETRFIPVDKEA